MYRMESIISLCAKLHGDNITRESLLFCGINRNADVKVSITEKTRANLTLCKCEQAHANIATAMSNFYEVFYCLFVFHSVRIQYEFPISHADLWKKNFVEFFTVNKSLAVRLYGAEWKLKRPTDMLINGVWASFQLLFPIRRCYLFLRAFFNKGNFIKCLRSPNLHVSGFCFRAIKMEWALRTSNSHKCC